MQPSANWNDDRVYCSECLYGVCKSKEDWCTHKISERNGDHYKKSYGIYKRMKEKNKHNDCKGWTPITLFVVSKRVIAYFKFLFS